MDHHTAQFVQFYVQDPYLQQYDFNENYQDYDLFQDLLEEEASEKLEEFIQEENKDMKNLAKTMTSLDQEIMNDIHGSSVYEDDVQNSFSAYEKWYYECDVCEYGSDKCKCMPCIMKVCDTVEYPIQVICPNSGHNVTRYVVKKVEYPRMFMI